MEPVYAFDHLVVPAGCDVNGRVAQQLVFQAGADDRVARQRRGVEAAPELKGVLHRLFAVGESSRDRLGEYPGEIVQPLPAQIPTGDVGPESDLRRGRRGAADRDLRRGDLSEVPGPLGATERPLTLPSPPCIIQTPAR